MEWLASLCYRYWTNDFNESHGLQILLKDEFVSILTPTPISKIG